MPVARRKKDPTHSCMCGSNSNFNRNRCVHFINVLCYFGAANLLHSYWHILAIAASLYADDLLNLALCAASNYIHWSFYQGKQLFKYLKSSVFGTCCCSPLIWSDLLGTVLATTLFHCITCALHLNEYRVFAILFWWYGFIDTSS